MVAILMGLFVLEVSRGPARGMPSQARNEDVMEHVRELRDEAEHEHLAREAEEANERHAPGRVRSALRRIFRR